MDNYRGRYEPEGGSGQGPGGMCVCPNCGMSVAHTRDQPCMKIRCQNCGSYMTRK